MGLAVVVVVVFIKEAPDVNMADLPKDVTPIITNTQSKFVNRSRHRNIRHFAVVDVDIVDDDGDPEEYESAPETEEAAAANDRRSSKEPSPGNSKPILREFRCCCLNLFDLEWLLGGNGKFV